MFITTGWSSNGTIKLGSSDNTVDAGAGANSITGGSEQDTFVLVKASHGFENIKGFTEANSKVLDLRAALAVNHKAATLGNYLKVSDSGGSATLLIAPTRNGSSTESPRWSGRAPLALLTCSATTCYSRKRAGTEPGHLQAFDG